MFNYRKIFSPIFIFAIPALSFAMSSNLTMVNNTNKNIRIGYKICKNHVCKGPIHELNFDADEFSQFRMALKEDQSVKVRFANEINAVTGKILPAGAKGTFNDCIGYPNKTLSFWAPKTPRILGMIVCQSN